VLVSWTDLLSRARTAHEVYGVVDAVLGDDDSALARLHQFIEAVATWYDANGDEVAKRRYRSLADDLDSLYTDLANLADDNLAAAHRKAKSERAAPHSEMTPPAAPVKPPPGPRR
jgi:hypothetical protein